MTDLNFSKSVDLVNELPAYFVIACSSVESMTILVMIGSRSYDVDLMNCLEPASKQSFRNYQFIKNTYSQSVQFGLSVILLGEDLLDRVDRVFDRLPFMINENGTCFICRFSLWWVSTTCNSTS